MILKWTCNGGWVVFSFAFCLYAYFVIVSCSAPTFPADLGKGLHPVHRYDIVSCLPQQREQSPLGSQDKDALTRGSSNRMFCLRHQEWVAQRRWGTALATMVASSVRHRPLRPEDTYGPSMISDP